MNDIITGIFLLLGGVGVFSLGMNIMCEGLERTAGKRTQGLFKKINNNRFLGVAIGAGVTGVIQSSTAVTIMVVGFVNAGAMSLFTATAIIMGSNIGTTLTGLLVSLSQLPINAIFMSLTLFGLVLPIFFKGKASKDIAKSLCGAGLLFVGLEVMSNSLAIDSIKDSFTVIFLNLKSPILLVVTGMVFTAIVQSSSATTSLMIILASKGALPLENALFLILGTNVGTCLSAIIVSSSLNLNAKRAAFIHLAFNLLGTIIFFIPLMLFPDGFTYILKALAPSLVGMQIAYFNLIQNIGTTLILLPFIKQLNKLAEHLIKKGSGDPKFKEKVGVVNRYRGTE